MNNEWQELSLQQPQAWMPEQLRTNTDWVRPLSGLERQGLLDGLESFLQTGVRLEQSTAADFAFGNLTDLIEDIHHQMREQFGMVVLKDFPIEALDDDMARALYWGFVNHLGVLRPQGKDSALMNQVKNAGGVYRAAGGRGYNTNAELDFHVDFADYVSLLCIREARSGGISRICSSRRIIEDMREQSPELVQALMQPLCCSRQDEHAADEAPFYRAPIVAIEQGLFSCRFTRNHIRYVHRHEGASTPTVLQNEAMDWIDRAAQSQQYTYDMRLAPGDLQLLNNHVTLHSRTAYEDHEDPDQKRTLLRAWIATPNSQPLSALMREAFHDHRAGAVRGGIKGQSFDIAKQDYTRKAAEFHHMLTDTQQ